MDGPAYAESASGDHLVEAMTLDSILSEHFSGLGIDADVEDAQYKQTYAKLAGGFNEGRDLASGENVCRGRDRLEVSFLLLPFYYSPYFTGPNPNFLF